GGGGGGGRAFVTERQLLPLRPRPPRPRTAYEVECLGPLVVELPAAATRVEASELTRSGHRRGLVPVRTHASVRLAPGRALRPAPGKQIVLVQWPRRTGSAYDDHKVGLAVAVPRAPLIPERVAYTASVSCGRSRDVAPVVPLGQGLRLLNPVTV